MASGTGHSEKQDTFSGRFRLINKKLLVCRKLKFVFPGKFTAMIILHFHLQPQFNELFHIYFTSERNMFKTLNSS